ncbi:unnamed protein product [Cochlearia groenlandica]
MASFSTSLLGITRVTTSSNYTKKKAEEKIKNAAFCKKHPKHRQSPGVCSLCLNEKLSIFIKATSTSSYSSLRRRKARQIMCSSSTTSSSCSSSSVSSCPSPLVDRRCYFLMDGGDIGSENRISWMTKSRSLACKVDDEKRKKSMRKGGFFFGLVGTRRDNKRVL